jgi:hypothetical protein
VREDAITIVSIAGQANDNRVENNVIAFNAGFGVSLEGGVLVLARVFSAPNHQQLHPFKRQHRDQPASLSEVGSASHRTIHATRMRE